MLGSEAEIALVGQRGQLQYHTHVVLDSSSRGKHGLACVAALASGIVGQGRFAIVCSCAILEEASPIVVEAGGLMLAL